MKTKTRLHKFTAWLLMVAMLMTFIQATLTVSAEGSVAAAINAVSDDPVPVVTDVKFNSNSPAYDEGTNTFYVSDSNPFILTVTGENLTLFNDMGGLEALFKGETSNSGWVITNMNIQSDTEANIVIGASSMSYILNNSFGSNKITAVMVENRNTRYGDTIYVNITHAPTYEIRIKDSTGGTVEHDNLFSNYIPWGSTVNISITPDNGYELESLTVDGTDVTGQVSGNTYTFTMPDHVVDVEAIFKSAPITYTVTVSAGKTEAVVGETVNLTAEVKANGTIVEDADVSWETTRGSGLNSKDALTATITPESAGVWTVTALYDPTPEDNEIDDVVTGSVTVTLTEPVIPAITDVVISGDAVTRDEDNKLYKVTAGEPVTITIYGTDFDKITEEDYTNRVYGVVYIENSPLYLNRNNYDDVSGNFIYDSAINDHFTGTDVQFTNDGGNTWIKTGWKLVLERSVVSYDLYVGGERFTEEKLTISDGNGGTAVYNPDTNTLTLNNYNYTGTSDGILYFGQNGSMLNLVLNGDNSLTAVPMPEHRGYSVAVICSNSGLVISGDGSLDAKVNDGKLAESAHAIYADYGITIKGGEITATAGETNNGQACGIISIYGDIIIDGGTVIATGGEGKIASGMCTNGNIIINGGNITATGGKADSGNDIGIFSAGGTITINGGNITAIGGETSLSTGIFSYSLTNITGGVVIAEGNYAAIYAYGAVSIGEGLGVYGKNGAVIENPDFNTLTYAKIDEYTVEKYILTWSNGDGGSYEQEVVYGTVIIVPDNEFFNDTMRKTGHTLTGWTNDDGYNVGDTMPAKDLSFTAQYTANTYTVSFDENGGAEIDPVTITYGEKYGTLPSSSITGLSGGNKNWYLVDEYGNVTDTNIRNLSKVETARNHTLYIKRSVLAPTLKITLEVPGAISDDYKYYVPGNSTRILTAVVDNKNEELLNYTYQWYNDDVLIEGATEAVLTLAGNVSDSGTYKVVVTASLKENTGIIVTKNSASAEKEKTVNILRTANTINYNANGGTGGATSNYSGGATITVSANSPERDSHHFAGWNTQPDGSGDNYNPGSTYTFENDNGNGGCDVTLYAQWREKETVFFDQSIQIYIYDGAEKVFEIKGTDLTDIAVKYKQNNLEIIPKDAGTYDVVITRAEDDTYKEIEATISGGLVISKKAIDSDIPLNAPVKNDIPQTEITGVGYTATVVWSPEVTDKFGYSTEYTATITIYPDANHTLDGITSYTLEGAKSVSISSNVVTVAYEKTGRENIPGGGLAHYTVTFDTNGGSTIKGKIVIQNSTVAEPTAPTKEGYTFDGWYKDKELTTEYDFDTMVTKNITLYAKWTEDENNSEVSGHNCPSLKFSDLDIAQWYHFDTDYVIENDIFRGTAKNIFTPNGNMTRAMMITVLYRAEGEPEVTGKATFEDIDENAYYAKAVLWGQQNGIIKGYSETEYAPEQDILREQIAAIMYRYAQYKGIDVSVGENTNILSYDDFAQISEYAIPSMQWAVGSGMIKGRTESTLNPSDNATRAEIAAILHRFIEANK